MLHLYIGDGKGKTTAALGCALRALGWGKTVYCAQFLKDTLFPCGELKAAKKYKLKLTIERFENQVHPIFLKKENINIGKIKASINSSLKKIKSLIRGKKFDVIILDEILDALEADFLSKKALADIVKSSKSIELIFTGRTAPYSIMRSADYISFIGKIKHPFDKKIAARKSIDY